MRAPTQTVERARELRRKLTLPEVVFWQAIRGKQMSGIRFRRHHPFGPYDFYCATARLAVEIDGSAHQNPGQYRHDTSRDAWLAQKGIRVLRFHATDVLSDKRLDEVLEAVLQAVDAAGSSPVKRGRGTMRSMVEGASAKRQVRSTGIAP
jgi:very-short-patch-repair endonuclease